MSTTTTKPRNPGRPGASSARDGTARARKTDHGRGQSPLFLALDWLRRKLSRATNWIRARIMSRMIRLLPRAVGWLRARIGPVARAIRSQLVATAGTDHGFGFWWLVAVVAISLVIGLIVAVLLSPVIGLVAALAAGIWMLVRRSRSAQSRPATAE